VLIEARVFACDERLAQALGQFFERNRNAAHLAEDAHQPAICRKDAEGNLELHIAQCFDVGEVAAVEQPGDADAGRAQQ
jgi:hypothetical protein